MTRVEIIYDNNIIIGFKMKGHAGFNLNGPDILCAALSTASQMTINGILNVLGFDYSDVVKVSNPKEAILDFILDTSEISKGLTVDIIVHNLLKSFEMYIEQLAEQYEGFVKLERRQKDDK